MDDDVSSAVFDILQWEHWKIELFENISKDAIRASVFALKRCVRDRHTSEYKLKVGDPYFRGLQDAITNLSYRADWKACKPMWMNLGAWLWRLYLPDMEDYEMALGEGKKPDLFSEVGDGQRPSPLHGFSIRGRDADFERPDGSKVWID